MQCFGWLVIKLCTMYNATVYSLEGRGRATLRLVSQRSIHTNNLDAVAGFGKVDKVIVEDNVDGSRKLAGRCTFGHFLDRYRLMVAVHAVPEFSRQRVSIVVGRRVGRRCRHQVARSCLVAVLAGVEQLCGVAVMYRFVHFGSNKRTCQWKKG